MAIDLAGYVGTSAQDDAFVAECLAEATELVTDYIRNATYVPDLIRDRAIKEVGAELFHRRNAPNGIRQFATPDGGADSARIARDPMTPAYPLLNPYLPVSFG